MIAFAASYTAVWTIASARFAGGGPSLASTTKSPALTFQSVTASALATGTLSPVAAANSVVGYLADHSATAAHARHIPMNKCETIGLKIEKLEDDKKLQDEVDYI